MTTTILRNLKKGTKFRLINDETLAGKMCVATGNTGMWRGLAYSTFQVVGGVCSKSNPDKLIISPSEQVRRMAGTPVEIFEYADL